MKKINKTKAIELILQELEKGITYSECFAVIRCNSPLSETTFRGYWKEANMLYSERQKSIQSELMSVRIDHEKERLKKSILTKDERMEIASKIAKGEAWKVKEELIIPTANDRMRALDYLSKVDGDYSSTKIDAEITTYNIPKLPDIIDRTK